MDEGSRVGGFSDGGEGWVDCDVVGRGGRAAVEDGHDGVGRLFPWRGWLMVHGVVGRLGVVLIRWSGFVREEFWPEPERLGHACRRRPGLSERLWREGRAAGGRGRGVRLGGCSRGSLYSPPRWGSGWGLAVRWRDEEAGAEGDDGRRVVGVAAGRSWTTGFMAGWIGSMGTGALARRVSRWSCAAARRLAVGGAWE